MVASCQEAIMTDSKRKHALEVARLIADAHPHGCQVLVEDFRQSLAIIASSFEAYEQWLERIAAQECREEDAKDLRKSSRDAVNRASNICDVLARRKS